jgi:ubiquinone/menaquinone biosynthesis C-methylase UbiE
MKAVSVLASYCLATMFLIGLPGRATTQEKSVRPGINQPFQNPDVKRFVGIFETESREIFAKRMEIVAACKLKPGMVVGDIGAGTGLFTRLFAEAVGPQGKVYAVDIARKFIDHIEQTCKANGLSNVVGVVCKPDSVELPANSIDLAFICDTYHHFEFPAKTLHSLHRALRPGGTLVLIDFRRIKGVSTEWVMNHVRAGQEVFTAEIIAAGFKPIEELKILKENYVLRIQRVDTAPSGAAWRSLWDGKTLDGWKPADYFGAGKVQVMDGMVVLEKGKIMTGLTYRRGDFPTMDYEVALEGKKLAGSDFFCTTTFPFGNSFCSFVVGGWGGTTVGLSSINSADASQNETSRSKEFEENHWYRVRIRVSRNRIEAWIDRDKFVDVDTTGRRIATRIECNACKPFGIATYQTTGALRDIRVRRLTEEEKREIAATRPTDPN